MGGGLRRGWVEPHCGLSALPPGKRAMFPPSVFTLRGHGELVVCTPGRGSHHHLAAQEGGAGLAASGDL